MARMASLVDGANEVHKVTIAKSELSRYQPKDGWPSEHVPTRLTAARARFAHLLEASA
jgi:acyl-CoA dehydrogenase